MTTFPVGVLLMSLPNGCREGVASDAANYAITLFVVTMALPCRALSALAKGGMERCPAQFESGDAPHLGTEASRQKRWWFDSIFLGWDLIRKNQAKSKHKFGEGAQGRR
jgi:hypothetical protein